MPTLLRPLPMYRLAIAIGLLSGLLPCCGCNLSGHEVLETRLRQYESTIRGLEQELDTASRRLTDQEKELIAIKKLQTDSPFRVATSGRSVETEMAWGAVRSLRVPRLTAGVIPTPDNGLQVSLIVQPVDKDGEVVKVAADLSVRIQDPGATEIIAQADFTPLESRELWSNGLIGRGFHIQLPLSPEVSAAIQSGDTLLLTAAIDLGNDRRFETSSLITVRLTDTPSDMLQ